MTKKIRIIAVLALGCGMSSLGRSIADSLTAVPFIDLRPSFKNDLNLTTHDRVGTAPKKIGTPRKQILSRKQQKAKFQARRFSPKF